MISHADLLRLMTYDPATGHFVWLQDPRVGPKRRGTIAGSTTDKGYIQILIRRKPYKAHRLAFFYMTAVWPANGIDHINGCRSDNRFTNLRQATQRQNAQNQRVRRDSNSKEKGVSKRPNGSFMAYIKHNGKLQVIGHFSTKEAASAAYWTEAQRLFGEFARRR